MPSTPHKAAWHVVDGSLQAWTKEQAFTYCAHDGGVQEHFSAAGLQGGALQGRDQVAHVEVDNVLQLVRRAVEQAVGARKLAACGVLLHLGAWRRVQCQWCSRTKQFCRIA